MNNFITRFFLSIVCLASIMTAVSSSIIAAPVKLNRIVQVVSAKPGRAATGGFSQLRLNEGPPETANGEAKSDGDSANKNAAPPQDDRMIVETTTEVVQDEDCNCLDVPKIGGGFPKLALLGLGAIPLVFLFRDKKDTPTPTPTTPTNGTETPTVTPTTTPTGTPTDSPTPTPTGTPTDSPTPPPTTPTPPEPVPEPMTILLFGTGLAGIGVAARKRFGKKENKDQA